MLWSSNGKEVNLLLKGREDFSLPFNKICLGLSMSLLTIFGLFSVVSGLAFYALEYRSHWFILAFALSCVLGSVYGFLQGAWPFGLVEAVWSIVAIIRWRVVNLPIKY